MKQLELKTTEISKGDDGDKATYDDLLRMVLNHRPREGFSDSDMMERLQILAALKEADDAVLVLGDADAEKLQAYTRAMRWPAIHEDFMAFRNDVLAMKEHQNGEEKEGIQKE